MSTAEQADSAAEEELGSKSSLNTLYGTKRGERKRLRREATLRKARASPVAAVAVPKSAEESAARWNAFYDSKPTFFKDRHILRIEFPELMSAPVQASPYTHVRPLSKEDGPATCDLILVEAGCGCGNGLFPILRANERIFAYAFDFSSRAIELLRSHSEYREDRVHAFVADVARADTYVQTVLDAGGAHFVTALWTLSALCMDDQRAAAAALASALRKGGLLAVRDYAEGDMRERMFLAKGKQVGSCKEGRTFLRGDGTLAHFFTTSGLISLFEGVGLETVRCSVRDREVVNRAEEMVMQRKWIQAVFRKPQ